MRNFCCLAPRLVAHVPFFVFLTTTIFGQAELINVSTSGTYATGGTSEAPSVSPDGRYVVFSSNVTDLTTRQPSAFPQVYLRDRTAGVTRRISMGYSGAEANGASDSPIISGDGKWVAFRSWASNLVRNDTNIWSDVFLYNIGSGTAIRVSVGTLDVQSNGNSTAPSISMDGRFVVFSSEATNLVANDTNTNVDVFIHDTATKLTSLVSTDSSGKQTKGAIDTLTSVSGDGRFVVFLSRASDLVASDTNGLYDVFLHDNVSGQTTRVSVSNTGVQGDYDCQYPSISADGRYVTFASRSQKLVADDRNEDSEDVFVYDRIAGKLARASQPADGGTWWGTHPSMSDDGRLIGFIGTGIAVADQVTGETLLPVSASGKYYDPFLERGKKSFNLSSNGRYLVFMTEGSAWSPTRIYLFDLSLRGRIFPQFLNGQGNRTRIILRNGSNQPYGGQIKFRDPQGAGLAIPVNGQSQSSIDYSIPAWGVLDLETDGTGPLAIGSLEVTNNLGLPTALEATEVFQVFGKQVSVDACPSRRSHSLYVSFNGQENTGVAVFNPVKQPITLQVNLRQEGFQVATAQVVLQGEQQKALFVDNADLFGTYLATHPTFKGYLTIQPLDDKVVNAVGLIQRRATGALIAVSTASYEYEAAAPIPALIFPQYANGQAGGVPNRTRLILREIDWGGDISVFFKSPTGQPATVNLAGQTGSSFQFQLWGGDTLDLETNGLGDLATGSIQVESSAGKDATIQGTEVFEILGNYVSVGNCPARSTHQVYASYSPQENTGVAIYNPESTSITATVRLLDSAGVEVESRSLSIPSQNQKAIFVDDDSLFRTYLAGVTQPFRGTLNMTVGGGKKASVIGLVQKRADGALLAIRTGASAFAP